jgi:hypothetical protein
VSLTLSAIRDAAGRVVGVSALVRDIADRRHAEAALRSAAQFNRQVIQSIIGVIATAISPPAGRLKMRFAKPRTGRHLPLTRPALASGSSMSRATL